MSTVTITMSSTANIYERPQAARKHPDTGEQVSGGERVGRRHDRANTQEIGFLPPLRTP